MVKVDSLQTHGGTKTSSNAIIGSTHITLLLHHTPISTTHHLTTSFTLLYALHCIALHITSLPTRHWTAGPQARQPAILPVCSPARQLIHYPLA